MYEYGPEYPCIDPYESKFCDYCKDEEKPIFIHKSDLKYWFYLDKVAYDFCCKYCFVEGLRMFLEMVSDYENNYESLFEDYKFECSDQDLVNLLIMEALEKNG